MCAHTAGFEGVAKGERAARIPCEPSRLDLFAPGAVDGWTCDIYPQCAGTRPRAGYSGAYGLVEA